MANTSTEASAKPKEVVEEKKSTHAPSDKTLTQPETAAKPNLPEKLVINEDEDDLEEMRQITEKAAKESVSTKTVKFSSLSLFIPDLNELPEHESEKVPTPKDTKSSKF